MLPGARSVPEEQVRIASTKMDGIGFQKAIQIRSRLGIKMIGQDHVVHWELKREERADIERLISISRYRGIRHHNNLIEK
ncbi:hypothetical protein MKX01_021855 [Papaver californicum]|nr:hypothetical protein MKX01_021855 [Papaver californicum]